MRLVRGEIDALVRLERDVVEEVSAQHADVLRVLLAQTQRERVHVAQRRRVRGGEPFLERLDRVLDLGLLRAHDRGEDALDPPPARRGDPPD